jgi:hypothetical protein
MASVTPAVRLIKLIVSPKAKTLSTGEKTIGICLFLRLLVFVPGVLVGLLIWDKRDSAPVEEPLQTVMLGAGAGVFYVVAILAVWWQKLVWKDDAIGVRSFFRKMKWYRWDDVKLVRGSRQSWVVQMTDGRKFRGNDWTNGAQEFLALLPEKTRAVLL